LKTSHRPQKPCQFIHLRQAISGPQKPNFLFRCYVKIREVQAEETEWWDSGNQYAVKKEKGSRIPPCDTGPFDARSHGRSPGCETFLSAYRKAFPHR